MFGNINFKRFDRTSSGESGFRYEETVNSKSYENNPQIVALENPGFNLHVSILNYMAEPVMLGANVRTNPTTIHTLLRGNTRPHRDRRNHVIVTIHSTEVPIGYDKTKPVQVRKSEIVIPGNMLNQGSVFIEELDCYLTTESNLEATRELIARDISDRLDQSTINLPASLVVQDPRAIYHTYKSLVEFCIKRQDSINIRIGFDLRFGTVPDIIKDMHVSILDHYFVPFADNKLVFDPTLDADEFIIENLHLASTEECRYRFSELAKVGKVYLDHELQDTLSGKFYGMALFANAQTYSEYLFTRKAEERFDDETRYLAERSGDPRLKEEIVTLTRNLAVVQADLDAAKTDAANLRDKNKRLKQDLDDRNQTITQIRDRTNASFSTDVVLRSMANETNKVENEAYRLQNDRFDQSIRSSSLKLTHNASKLKSIAEIMKTGWGIVAGIVGGILAVLALLKKYNVKISMG